MLNRVAKRAFCQASKQPLQATTTINVAAPAQPKVNTEGIPISLTAHPENTSAAVVDAIKTPTKTHPNADYKVVVPKFQMMETSKVMNPKKYNIDCSKYDMLNLTKDQRNGLTQEVKDKFHDVGLCYMTNTGLKKLDHMREWASIVVDGTAYTGGANPRNALPDAESPNVYDVGAPKEAWLHYHHEMVYVGKSPLSLALFCAKRVENKGWTYISENMQVTDHILSTPMGQKLKKGICYIRNLTDKEYYKNKGMCEGAVYNHCQDSFDTTDPDEAVELARKRDLKTEWVVSPDGNRFLKTKYYCSAYEYFPQYDRNVLYSSIADDFMWFDTWPGVKETPFDERPLRLTFGDDEELTQAERQQYVDEYDRFGFPIQWNVGDIAMLCNYRWAHGRPTYTLEEGEERELGVLLGQRFDRIGQVEGKWQDGM